MVSSGIGSGLILGGRLHRGATGFAGELGHVLRRREGRRLPLREPRLPRDRRLDGRAARRCSGRRTAPDLTVAGVLELVAAGDRAANRVVYDVGRAIGRVLAGLINCLDPQAIIVGGELSPAGEPLLNGIRDAIDRYALPGASRSVEVRAGVLGDRAEVLGALALVISDTERLRSVGLAALHGDARSPVPA